MDENDRKVLQISLPELHFLRTEINEYYVIFRDQLCIACTFTFNVQWNVTKVFIPRPRKNGLQEGQIFLLVLPVLPVSE